MKRSKRVTKRGTPLQGFFRLKFPEKYIGDSKNVVFRSSYELKAFRMLDLDPTVLRWSSEEIIVPYRSPLDGKIHRYFPDLYVEKKREDGHTDRLLCEVKPAYQTSPPKVEVTPSKKKPSAKYLREVETWAINDSKWKAARAFCKDRGWEFLVLSEKELGIKNGR